MAVVGFRLYCLSMVGYSVNVTLRLYYQAIRQFALSYVYVALNGLFFTAAGALILSSFMGTNGVWLAFLFGETLTLITLTVFVLLRKSNEKKFFEKFLLLPKGLMDDVVSRYDGMASSAGEVVTLSEEVRMFCKENRTDERTAYWLALAVEELGENILQNNLQRKAKTEIEVRVLQRTDGITLRIRDNGKKSNPLDVLKSEKKDDVANIGVKLISKLITNIEYLDTLNLNNLILEIKNREGDSDGRQ